MHQCNLYCTKLQYDKSNELLASWLASDTTVSALGIDLVNKVKLFQANLIGKEDKLAQYHRKEITMCADAMTTSPVESMNDLIKNKQKISSNFNLSKSVERIVVDQTFRYEKNCDQMRMQMNRTVLSSRSPTKHDVTSRCQHMIDFLHDKSAYLKCAHVDDNTWICWNFVDPEKRSTFYNSHDELGEMYEVNEEELDRHTSSHDDADNDMFVSSLKVPNFLNVYELHVNSFNGNTFLKCSCCYYKIALTRFRSARTVR